ncbi:1-phosphofructokinase [Actinomadura rubrisoli]|uniref:1-phosphofructokinase n=1 Tax=Actinomadura rubrisoli TaxID=2530368 RepID=A0A4R5A1Y9_9ACTN|nr:1-phosphofructokinase [Actinomadura rubrisoli]TDD65445.1 1-phosphofructokinase [Actinomadura rubrisoli]
MIVTVTLNPSLDRTIEVDALTRGAVIRARSARLDPGGKGVNVSRALLAAGVPSVAVLPVGGPDGHRLQRLLEEQGLTVRAVPVRGCTRSNVTIVEPGGMVTKLNEPGGRLSRAELDAVVQAVVSETRGASWVVACGSLPPGVPDGFYGELCKVLAPARAKVAVDTSGPALPAAVRAGPDLVKPNREELTEAVGRPVGRLSEAIDAAGLLCASGARAVLVSLGAEGAVLVDGDGVRTGRAPVARPKSTVGAGDALLAGFLAAGARGSVALAAGLAWGAAAVRQPAGRMPGIDEIGYDGVHIQRPPVQDRPLIA